MATAGDRYNEITGNIWSYANRGDMTGVKAALLRNVSVDAVNTAGWSPLHAAAAGGNTHVLLALIRARADVTIRDRGGNLAAHEAARGGHLQCLEALSEAGVPLSEVRLSQTKGAAVRKLVTEATRSAAKAKVVNDNDEQEEAVPVGYARQKQKSCAFWGPRRTPISCKLKRELLKEKRKHKDSPASCATADESLESPPADAQVLTDGSAQCFAMPADGVVEPAAVPRSYVDTVKAVKREARMSRRARRTASHAGANDVEVVEGEAADVNSNEDHQADSNASGNSASLGSGRVLKGFSVLAESSGEESTTDVESR